jgi:hypothetical protein
VATNTPSPTLAFATAACRMRPEEVGTCLHFLTFTSLPSDSIVIPMPKEKVFHLWPYHLRFKAERLYYNGKYMNLASHEYAVWATSCLHFLAFTSLPSLHCLHFPAFTSLPSLSCLHFITLQSYHHDHDTTVRKL